MLTSVGPRHLKHHFCLHFVVDENFIRFGAFPFCVGNALFHVLSARWYISCIQLRAFIALLIYQLTNLWNRRNRQRFHVLHPTKPREFLDWLQKYCNFRRFPRLLALISMQSVEVYMLHSFFAQVYSFRQGRQNRAKHERNICSFFACFSSIYIFLFVVSFVIIIVYNEPLADKAAEHMFSIY